MAQMLDRRPALDVALMLLQMIGPGGYAELEMDDPTLDGGPPAPSSGPPAWALQNGAPAGCSVRLGPEGYGVGEASGRDMLTMGCRSYQHKTKMLPIQHVRDRLGSHGSWACIRRCPSAECSNNAIRA